MLLFTCTLPHLFRKSLDQIVTQDTFISLNILLRLHLIETLVQARKKMYRMKARKKMKASKWTDKEVDACKEDGDKQAIARFQGNGQSSKN